jgi:agmatinase
LRPWNPALDVSPLAAQQVADAGDIACNPFDIAEAVGQIEAGAAQLLDSDRSVHVGIRGPLYAPSDLTEDAELGFAVVRATELETSGIAGVVQQIRARVGDAPLYISIDIDVLDPAHAPGTGTPEAGGLTSRELLGILRGLAGSHLVGADLVEVAPAYDHAEITAIAAAHVAYEILTLLLLRPH